MAGSTLRPLDWVGSSRKDFGSFPEPVQDAMGFALYTAQLGKTHSSAKPLRGFGGSGVVELVEDFRTNTYRTVYTVRFPGTLYVLHAFQKKAKRGSETPKQEIELVRTRLRVAEQDYRSRKEQSHGG
jgi:phage-related protein